MSVEKRNGVWCVRYRDQDGKNKRVPIGPGKSGYRQAQAYDHQIKAAKQQKAPLPEQERSKPYLAEICQDWLVWKKGQGRKPRWLKEWASVLNQKVLPELSHAPADELSMREILDAVERIFADASPTTRHRYTGYLKSAYRFAVLEGTCARNPLAQWTMPQPRKRDVRLTVADLRKIMRESAPHLAWAIEVAWHLGARPGETELLSIKWEDVHWERKAVRIRGTKTRQSDRFVPVSDAFLARLRERRLAAVSLHVILKLFWPGRRSHLLLACPALRWVFCRSAIAAYWTGPVRPAVE